MLRLRTLGEVYLEGGTGDLSGRRKDLVLLAYLTRKAPRPVSRAELATLLWGDRDEGRGRQSLRQALLELKRVVGPALTVDPEQARVDPAAMTTDAGEFERAIAEGRLEQAAGSWKGDFLAGLEDLGGETLRVWLEIEREALRRSLAFALDRLSVEAERRRDWERAVEWAEQWDRFLPHDERAGIRLVEVLLLAGRPAEARIRHTALTARLRSELDREPSAELTALGGRIERELVRGHSLHRPGSAALFTPDMVGRGAALAELAAAWEAALGGEATVILVEGETGIGKTRLVEEFLRQTPGGGRVVVATMSAATLRTEGKSLAAGLLTGLAEAPGLGAANPTSLAAAAEQVPKLRKRFPDLPERTGETSLEAAAAEVASAAAEEKPLLWFVDDLEYADEGTGASVGAIARAVAGRVLTVVAVAADAGSQTAVQRLIPATRLRRLKLPALTLADVEALVASMLVIPDAQRHTLAVRLHEEAGGNPLYTIELAAALVDEGVLALDERGAWTLHAERWSASLPGGLRAIIERRTSSLSEDARAVAEAIARLEPAADDASARKAAGLPPERFDAGRDELIARRLLRVAAAPASGYQFHHQVVRRAIVADGARRRSATGARGRWRRGVLAAVAGAAVAALGTAAMLRGRPAPEPEAPPRMQVLLAPVEVSPGATPADSAMAGALHRALERELANRSPTGALIRATLARMRRADTSALPDAAVAREVATRLGVPLMLVASVTRSGDRVTAAYRIENTATAGIIRAQHAEATDSAPLQLSALLNGLEGDVSDGARQVPVPEPLPAVTTASLEALRAYASGARFLNLGEDGGAPMLRRAVALDSAFATAQAKLAYVSWFDYDQRAAERHAAAALRALDGLPTEERLRARLDAAHAIEDWPTAIECAREIIELDPAQPHPWLTLGQILYFDRQFSTAVAAFDSARARDDGRYAAWLSVSRATVVARMGQLEAAVKDYEAGFAAEPPFRRHPYLNHEYGASLMRLGRVDDARAAYAVRLDGTPTERAGALRSTALLEAHQGRFGRAKQLLDDALAAGRAAGDSLETAIAHLLRAEVLLTQGDTVAGRADLLALYGQAQAGPLPYEVVTRAVKLLARAGDTDRAASLLARLESRTTAVSHAARSRLLLARGEVLLARGRATEGRGAVEQALALDPTTDARESAGHAALAAGDLLQAAQRYEAVALERGIDWDGHAVIELGHYLAAQVWDRAGNGERARAGYENFLAQWSSATPDSTLPALIEARRRLERERQGGT